MTTSLPSKSTECIGLARFGKYDNWASAEFFSRYWQNEKNGKARGLCLAVLAW
jgi:hypothetical protein